MQRLSLLPGKKPRVPDPAEVLFENRDSCLTLDQAVKVERGVQKYIRKLEAAGVPPDRLRHMARKYRAETLHLRQLEARLKLELPSLGFGPYDWVCVRVLVRKLYGLQRKYACLTLAQTWAFKATEAVWDGLDKRAVRRLVYRSWQVLHGTNSLSDLRMLRRAMVRYMGP
jgi:hypothetical protein